MDLRDRQLALEAESVSLGYQRYDTRKSDAEESELTPGRWLINHQLAPMTELVEEVGTIQSYQGIQESKTAETSFQRKQA